MAGSWIRSQLLPLDFHPYRTDAGGNVVATLDGVFILLSDDLIEALKTELTQAQKDEVASYVYRVTTAQAETWHVPLWAGDEDGAVFLRIPAAVWNDPTSEPPLRVKRLFGKLWQEIQAQ